MAKRQRDHLSYLLHLWQTGDEEGAVWRALLENPFTGKRLGVASLQDLFALLEAQIDNAASQMLETENGEGDEEI